MSVDTLMHGQNYKILPLDLRDEYRKLATDDTLRFVIYNGQSDANVPYNGQVQYWATPDAGFSVLEDWAPWYRSGKSAPAAGHVRTYAKAGQEFKFGTLLYSIDSSPINIVFSNIKSHHCVQQWSSVAQVTKCQPTDLQQHCSC